MLNRTNLEGERFLPQSESVTGFVKKCFHEKAIKISSQCS